MDVALSVEFQPGEAVLMSAWQESEFREDKIADAMEMSLRYPCPMGTEVVWIKPDHYDPALHCPMALVLSDGKIEVRKFQLPASKP